MCCLGMLKRDNMWLCVPQVQYAGQDTGLQAGLYAGSRSAHHAVVPPLQLPATARSAWQIHFVKRAALDAPAINLLEHTRHLHSWKH